MNILLQQLKRRIRKKNGTCHTETKLVLFLFKQDLKKGYF